MVLLVSAPTSSRDALVSFLEHEHLAVKTCDNFGAAKVAYIEAQLFEVIIADHRAADGFAQTFIGRLAGKCSLPPIIVLGAPLRVEAELYQLGAISVHGPGYSPHSVALQCGNLERLANRSSRIPRRTPRRPAADFCFGIAQVSAERRSLIIRSSCDSRPRIAQLSTQEVCILEALHRSPGKILRYEFLYHSIWHRGYKGRNGAIRQAVSSLRAKFKLVGLSFCHWVTTVYGIGLRYDRTPVKLQKE